MNPYSSLKEDGKFTLFVNSEEPPYEEIPMDHYYYRQDGNNFIFYRLHRVIYQQEGQIKHSLYDWRQIEVKSHCVHGFKQFIDSMASAIEFLK